MSEHKKSKILSAGQILDTMKYLGYTTHDDQGNLTEAARHISQKMGGSSVEHSSLGPAIAKEFSDFGAIPEESSLPIDGTECEFCGDPATRTEGFDRTVYVCDACHAN